MNVTTGGIVKFLLLFGVVGGIIQGQRIGALINLTLLVLWYEWRESKQKSARDDSKKDTEDESEPTTDSV